MILVLGGMGRIGTAAIAALHARGTSSRALVPARQRVPWLHELDVELVAGCVDDALLLDQALEGVQSVILVARPSAEQVDLEKRVIDRCADRGIPRLVKWSVAGADEDSPSDAGRWHWRAEQHLQRSVAEPCIARSGRLMQDLLYQTPLMLAHHMLVGCQGLGAAADVDARDVGAVLAALATTHSPPAAPLLVTGPEAVTQTQTAEILGHAQRLELRHVPCTPDELAQFLSSAGLQDWQAQDLVAYESAAATGQWNRVSDVVPTWTGRPARALADFAHETATSLQYQHFLPSTRGAPRDALPREVVMVS